MIEFMLFLLVWSPEISAGLSLITSIMLAIKLAQLNELTTKYIILLIIQSIFIIASMIVLQLDFIMTN